jgi:hypothetical protein
MALKITPAVRSFYKKLASEGGKARAEKYDHEQLSAWAKLGGRPRNRKPAERNKGKKKETTK